ncbi:hypothetical protein [Azorhizobium caulinodans]|uniref:hypothetical protein n=1 Tax=Azorhizobium caulinodans TaxID=7 RepID=UPI002FBE6E7D
MTQSLAINLDDEAPKPVTSTAPLVLDEGSTAVVDEDGELEGALPKRATRNADGSVTLTLIQKVSLRVKKDGLERTDEYPTLTFHRLRGADIRAVSSAKKEDQPAVLFARSARIRELVMVKLFDEMDAEDIAAGTRIVESFFGSGPTTRP